MNDFQSYLEHKNLKQSTINNHMKYFSKLSKIFDNDLATAASNDKVLVDKLTAQSITNSQKLALANTLSNYLKFLNLPNDNIVKFINAQNQLLKKKYENRNRNMKYKYTKRVLLNEMNSYYDAGEYLKYIITYLVIKFNVRNTDL